MVLLAALVVLAACTGSESESEEPDDPDGDAIASGFVALCNDGNYSNNDDLSATCSGGDGIDYWLGDYGQCVNGRIILMDPDQSCDDMDGFDTVLPANFVPEPTDGDVALCSNGLYSDNPDFGAACSSNGGVDRWLAPFVECVGGDIVALTADNECADGVVVLLDSEPAAPTTNAPAPTTIDTTTTTLTTTTSVAPTTTVAQEPAAVEEALDSLAELIVAQPDPTRSPYIRDDYDGDGWDDQDGDCVNTRHELLESLSVIDPRIEDCRVTAGRWIDPYSATIINNPDQATIDHVVPIAEAHRAGAWQWDTATKRAFANDLSPGHLLVTGQDSNQAKADSRPDQWLPPDPTAHCQYAIDWITTKARYALTVVAAEAAALDTALDSCVATSPVRSGDPEPPPQVVVTTPTTTTTTTIALGSGAGEVELLACNVRAERVLIGNPGGEPVSLSGYVLHDFERRHEVALGQFGSLQPGQQLAILTGGDAQASEGAVVWKRQNVWNNDGDTAHIIDPSGSVQQLRC